MRKRWKAVGRLSEAFERGKATEAQQLAMRFLDLSRSQQIEVRSKEGLLVREGGGSNLLASRGRVGSDIGLSFDDLEFEKGYVDPPMPSLHATYH